MKSIFCFPAFFLFLLNNTFSQDLSGNWKGILPQDDKSYNYSMETTIKQVGSKLTGSSKYIDINNFWVVEEFSGSIVGTTVTLIETRVIKHGNFWGFNWCVKKMIGELSIDRVDNQYVIEGTWTSDKVFDGTNYLPGSCAPGKFRITKKMSLQASVSGQVIDKQTFKPVKTRLSVTGKNSEKQVIDTFNDGTYSFKMPMNELCSISIINNDYEAVQESFMIDKPTLVKNFFLVSAIKEATVLNNVLFIQSSDILLKESFPELDKLAELMHTKKTIHIRLEGHTDKIGDAKENMSLSENRVVAVKQYLVKKGISPERISVKGYGDTKTICTPPCDKNRRVEFVITKE